MGGGIVEGAAGSGDSRKPMKKFQGVIQGNMAGEFIRKDQVRVPPSEYALQRAAMKCKGKCQVRFDCCNVTVKPKGSIDPTGYNCYLHKGKFGKLGDSEIEKLSKRGPDGISFYKENIFCMGQ